MDCCRKRARCGPTDSELHGSRCVAGGDGARGHGVRPGNPASDWRAIRARQSNAPRGGFHSEQCCRRACLPDEPEGISKVHSARTWLVGRARNTAGIERKTPIPQGGEHRRYHREREAHGSAASRTASIADIPDSEETTAERRPELLQNRVSARGPALAFLWRLLSLCRLLATF
jgi:hypothetical protein